MKNKTYKYLAIFTIMAIITCTMVAIDNKFTETINRINEKIEDQHILIQNLNNEIDEHLLEINELEQVVVELSDELIYVNTTLKALEKKINNVATNTQQVSTKSTRSSDGYMTFEATAYSGDTITATGTVPKVGRTIAVDPKVIPYGSKVHIEGMGTYIAEDCGGAVKGNIIDIFMNSSQECKNWGRRPVKVKIL